MLVDAAKMCSLILDLITLAFIQNQSRTRKQSLLADISIDMDEILFRPVGFVKLKLFFHAIVSREITLLS